MGFTADITSELRKRQAILAGVPPEKRIIGVLTHHHCSFRTLSSLGGQAGVRFQNALMRRMGPSEVRVKKQKTNKIVLDCPMLNCFVVAFPLQK